MSGCLHGFQVSARHCEEGKARRGNLITIIPASEALPVIPNEQSETRNLTKHKCKPLRKRKTHSEEYADVVREYS